jgi:hypothetical protein
LHTLTATDTLTSVALETQQATATETATKIEQKFITKTENAITTVVQPVHPFLQGPLRYIRSCCFQTTYTSIWLTTEVNNETETLVQTKSKTVVG